MKIYSKLIVFALTLFLFNACTQDYIDSITKVDPGTDESAPQITVNFPPDGYELQTNEAVTSIDIDFKVTDDIEIKSISLKVDGSEINNYSEFKDYRVAMEKYTYDNVTTGSHVLTVEATDTDGKTSTTNVNFTKAPPYVPQYVGETFYMPFNNEYREMNSLTLATAVGMPGFTDGIQQGTAYQGAADSYLTFPGTSLQGDEFSATFWLKLPSTIDSPAGLLVMSQEDTANPDAQNVRTSGFRLFYDNSGGLAQIKGNVGTGDGETWVDGGDAAKFDPAVNNGWLHVAFTISKTEATLYVNGQLIKQSATTGVDWTGCDLLSIMSGAPRFTGWGHYSCTGDMDELRLYNKALSQAEIQTMMLKEESTFHMGFNGNYKDAVSGEVATVVGSPDYAYGDGVSGDAYQGATDSYLTFPTTGLQGSEFSASCWLKLPSTIDSNAGILVMGPEDTANPDAQNDRTSGFRFFYDNSGGLAYFKVNVGTGSGETWVDGGDAAKVDPAVNSGWIHLAMTISGTDVAYYINGQQVGTATTTGIDWTGCDLFSIMSGAPRFTGWGHLSCTGEMDELYLFNKALSADEVTLLANE